MSIPCADNLCDLLVSQRLPRTYRRRDRIRIASEISRDKGQTNTSTDNKICEKDFPTERVFEESATEVT